MLGDNAGCFRGREVGEIKRKLSGEQLEQDHAKGIEVRVEADAVAANLLGSRIGGSHQSQPGHGLVDGSVEAFELFGDSEVEQADAAILFDENVRRLEVAVDDGLAMRVLDGLAHG